MKLIIWDLDGTLVDSLSATLESINDGVEVQMGRRLSAPEIMQYFGTPEETIIEKIVGNEHSEQCYSKFLDSMHHRLKSVCFFDGIDDTLTRLHAKGYISGIFTARGKRTTEIIVEQLQLRTRFIEIVTAHDVQQSKPHPDGIYKVAEAANIKLTNAVMIGDTAHDMNAAKAAGILALGCVWDARAKENELAGANAIVRHPREIESWLLNRNR